MRKYERLLRKGRKYFRRITGMRQQVFEKLLEILGIALKEKHAKGGRNPNLSIAYILLIALEYWREYRTFAAIGADFNLDESNVCRWVKWCEDVLMASGQITLPGKKVLLSGEYESIQIDATETPVERPKHGQRKYYSGKKKRHTIKSQIVIDKATKKIICVKTSEGKRHDFKLFKDSKLPINKNTKVETDSGYQGIKDIHKNSEHPKKKPRNGELTPEEKAENKRTSQNRIGNEHAIGFIKRFRILSERYRNRRKRFSLRLNLIAAICNMDIDEKAV
jgi:hypothetical protein